MTIDHGDSDKQGIHEYDCEKIIISAFERKPKTTYRRYLTQAQAIFGPPSEALLSRRQSSITDAERTTLTSWMLRRRSSFCHCCTTHVLCLHRSNGSEPIGIDAIKNQFQRQGIVAMSLTFPKTKCKSWTKARQQSTSLA